jgi:aspartate racemase
MKTIGLIGGVTWESTSDYYRLINSELASRLGGAHSARIVLVSIDFDEVLGFMQAGNEEAIFGIYLDAARRLQLAGADFLVLCANTAHRRADRLTSAVSLPLLHIADATGAAVKHAGITTIGLLGTRATMEESFISNRLRATYGLRVHTPEALRRQEIDNLIYEEMSAGIFSAHARRVIADEARTLASRGAQGIVLGCTELPILMRGHEFGTPVFDTTKLHAIAAVEHALHGDRPIS